MVAIKRLEEIPAEARAVKLTYLMDPELREAFAELGVSTVEKRFGTLLVWGPGMGECGYFRKDHWLLVTEDGEYSIVTEGQLKSLWREA